MTVRDASGQALQGVPTGLAVAGLSAVTSGAGATDSDGVFEGEVTSDETGIALVSALIGGVEVVELGPESVAFIPEHDGCGNGLRERGEACDDGNRVSDDGCRADCLGAIYVDSAHGEHGNQIVTVEVSTRSIVLHCLHCDPIVLATVWPLQTVLRYDERGSVPLGRTGPFVFQGDEQVAPTPIDIAVQDPGSFAWWIELLSVGDDGALYEVPHVVFGRDTPSGEREIGRSWAETVCAMDGLECRDLPNGQRVVEHQMEAE